MSTLISTPIEPKQKLSTKIREKHMRKQTKEIKHQTTNKHGHAQKCKNITPIVIEKKNNSKQYK